MPLDDYLEQGIHIDRYCSLESDLLRFLDFISLDFYRSGHERESIKSVFLADLLLRIGSNIDIFFRKYIKSYDIGVCTEIKTSKPNENDWNWADYKKLEQLLTLSDEYVVITSTGEKLYPFKGNETTWNMIGPSDNYWWNSYNNVKHNAEFDKANLDNVLQALGALLLLICRQSNAKKLTYYGFISIDKNYLKTVLNGDSDGRNTTMVASRLYLYPHFIHY
jgi:hypothetical protein